MHRRRPRAQPAHRPPRRPRLDERIQVELDGHTLVGEKVTRTIPVCGPAAFTVLKALAFGDRAEPKDAYDLVYVLRSTPDVPGSVADRLAEHAQHHDAIVRRALELLQRDFADIDGLGPRRTASFEFLEPEEQDAATADAHGHVNDLLRACQARDLVA